MEKYPSIDQYRHFVRDAKRMGLSTVKIRGTVKIHGTNAGIRFEEGEIKYQSRHRELTPITDDNMGFATYMAKFAGDDKYALNLRTLVSQINEKGYHSQTAMNTVTIYGEWCGKGVQAGVAVSELERMFVIFAIKIGDEWLDMAEMAHVELPEARIFNIMRFGTWELVVDLNYPEIAQNRLAEVTERVEIECPVGKYFGVEGIGEGVVWRGIECNTKGLAFKVKGQKHSASKVRKLATVDTEKVNSIKEFVDMSVTESRMRQGIDYLVEMGKPLDQTSTGDFIRWVFNDVVKEESDTLIESGLTGKDIGSAIATLCRPWYFKYLDELECNNAEKAS